MLKERRNSPRYHFNRYARIQVEMSGPSRDCLIVNMSEEGVRLHSEVMEMPNEFTLVIADAEHPRRTCRVVWRLGFEFGAKFTDLDRLPARRPSARAVLAQRELRAGAGHATSACDGATMGQDERTWSVYSF